MKRVIGLSVAAIAASSFAFLLHAEPPASATGLSRGMESCVSSAARVAQEIADA